MTGPRAEPALLGPTPPPAGADQRAVARALASDATELRNVTVLFTDVVRSTDAVLKLDPDAARDYLDGPVETMLAGVRKFGGAIGNIQGDGVMAVFGASAATEDHALRACMAAMEIRDGLTAVAPYPGVPQIVLRFGVHSGGASMRRVSGGLGEEFDAIGAVVHVASKIEKLCPPGSVCASSATLKLVRGYVRSNPIGEFSLGSDETSLQIDELLEVSPDYRLDHYFARRPPSALVGREAELLALGEALRPTATRPAVVGLAGEAGLGKSRLCYEATRLAASAGYWIAEIRGASLNSATPFAPLAPCLEPLLLLDQAQRDEPLASQLAAFGLTPLEVEAVATVLGAPQTDGAWNRIPGGARNRAIVDGVAKTLCGLARRRPLLLIVEDLHDVDHETRACLRRTTQLLRNTQSCIVVTARPQGAAALDEICGRVIWLDALSRQDSLRLLHNEVVAAGPAAKQVPSNLIEDVLERANGNPFMLEELLWAIGSPNNRGIGGVPMSIEILIRSRIDKLPAEARRLLHCASVLGIRSPAVSLRGIAGIEPALFEKALRELVHERFLTADSGLSVEFVHQITRLACYEGIPRGRRVKLHESVLAAAENDGRQLSLSFEALADHAYRAGKLDKALDHLWEACRESIASSALRSVAELRRRAHSICEEIGPRAATRIVDFELISFDALQQLGAFREVVGSLEAALAVSEAAGAQRKICQACGHLATTYWELGRYDEAHAMAVRAYATATRDNDMPLASYAQFILGCIQFNRGLPDEAVRLESELVTQLGAKLERARFGAVAVMSVMGRAFLSWFLSDLGRFEEARVNSVDAMRVAEAMDQPYSKALAYMGEGFRLFRMGRAEEAVALLHAAYEICMTGQFTGLQATAAGWYAGALIRSDQREAARPVVQRAIDFDVGAAGYVPSKARIYEAHARLLAGDGRAGAALAAAEQAVKFVCATRDPLHYAYMVFARGEVKAALSIDRESVRRDFNWALRRAVKLGMRPLEAQCRGALRELG